MELGNFLGKLKGKNKEVPESFLALVLTNNLVQSAVWRVIEGKTELISLGTPVEWDGESATTNELVQAVDATLSSAIEGLESEPEKIIFGLANTWVNQSGILGSKKDLIKSICTDLELKPLGYVVLSDCILKYLKMQEGTPTTSILVQVSHSDLSLSLVKLGIIAANVVVNSSGDLASDVAEGISKFHDPDPLPSRLIVVSSMENTSEIVQALTAYDWTKQFNFLHTPKIEALPKDIEVHATAVAGGTEVATSLGFLFAPPQPPPEPEVPPEPPSLLSSTDVGFMPMSAPKEEPITPIPTQNDHRSLPKFSLPKIKLPHFALPFKSKTIPYLIISAILLLIAGFSLLYFIPHAQLTLLIQAKPLEQSLTLSLSDQITQLDIANQLVPAQKTLETITGTKSIPTTGDKKIGDPAHGEVTIYNRTSLPKTFTKGTTLSSAALKFTLDEDVTIASKSAGSDYVDVPGKSNVKITAKEIGSMSNLGAQSEFVVASFGKDSYVAKNETALSGGSSKSVTVVTTTDKNNLVKDLTTELLDQLQSSLSQSSAPDSHYILDEQIEIESENYSAKVGEESETLDGTLTLTVPVLRYRAQDVESLISNEINNLIPPGYTRTPLPPSIVLEKSQVEDSGIVEATAKVIVYVLPSLDVSSLRLELKGISQSQLTSRLSKIPGYLSYQLVITPRYLPPRLQSLPSNPANIKIIATPSL